MSSSSEDTRRGRLVAGRARWVWLAVAGLLGLWLIFLLASGNGKDAAPERRALPDQALPRFEGQAAKPIGRRREVGPIPSSEAFRIEDETKGK